MRFSLGSVLHSSRLRLTAALALAVVAVALASSPASAGPDRVVRTQGDNKMVPNALIMSTLKFTPGNVTISSGDTLTLSHTDRTQEPHTLTIVNQEELPTNIDEVFQCEVCFEAFEAFPEEPAGSMFLNAPGTGPGLDGRFDTLFVLPGESASVDVTAPSGSTLHFLCLIHPWMMGQVRVR